MLFRIAARTGGGPLSRQLGLSTLPFSEAYIFDVWRYLHPDTIAFSWTRHDGLLAFTLKICLFGVCIVSVSLSLSIYIYIYILHNNLERL